MKLVAIIELVDTEKIKNRVIVLHDVKKIKIESDEDGWEIICIQTDNGEELFESAFIKEFKVLEEFYYYLREDN